MTRPKRRSEQMAGSGGVKPFGELQPRLADLIKTPRTFLIVCEGTQTEPNYFRGFRLDTAKILGKGYAPLPLVRAVIALQADSPSYDKYWCVFDRDSFHPQGFNQALLLARQNNISVAYSNEAFELWYLLHFSYLDSGLSRNQYENRLTKLLGHKYLKNSTTMYDELEDKQSVAIRNAERLLLSYGSQHNPEKDNPSTAVHQLVQALCDELKVIAGGVDSLYRSRP